MSRQDKSRLDDIVEAIAAIRAHLVRGGLSDGLVYDAVRVRLIEIGEAVKGIRPDLLEDAPDVPWAQIARMRDHLAHRYFDTDHAIIQDIVDNELDPLLSAGAKGRAREKIREKIPGSIAVNNGHQRSHRTARLPNAGLTKGTIGHLR